MKKLVVFLFISMLFSCDKFEFNTELNGTVWAATTEGETSHCVVDWDKMWLDVESGEWVHEKGETVTVKMIYNHILSFSYLDASYKYFSYSSDGRVKSDTVSEFYLYTWDGTNGTLSKDDQEVFGRFSIVGDSMTIICENSGDLTLKRL